MRICPQPKGKSGRPQNCRNGVVPSGFDDSARDAVAYMLEPFERGSATRRNSAKAQAQTPLRPSKSGDFRRGTGIQPDLALIYQEYQVGSRGLVANRAALTQGFALRRAILGRIGGVPR